MPIQPTEPGPVAGSNRVVVAVPTIFPSISTAKQPLGSNAIRFFQS